MKVGDTVWIFDPNTRHYTEPEKGKIWGSLIYRGHFVERRIESENRASWILNDHRKVNKKTLDGIFVSEAAIDDACFLHAHAYKIGDHVRAIKDPALLRRVAELIGYSA